MDDRDYILTVLKNQAEEWIAMPRCGLPYKNFENRAYQNWAVEEVLKEIREAEHTPPVKVIGKFIKKMEEFSCRKAKNSVMFSAAKEAVEWMPEVLMAMDYERRNDEDH